MSAAGKAPTAAERKALAAGPPAAGLCAGCEHLRLLSSKASVFVRCALAEVDPRFSRYPSLPVLACPGFRPAASTEGGAPAPRAGVGPGRR